MTQDVSAVGRKLIAACAAAIAANADRLTALDQAIGDGDHGANMKRGFAALAEAAGDIAALPPSEALKKSGMTLVMKVGGASGPLYGSLLMAMGKAEGVDDGIDAGRIAAMLGEGIAAVKARGKSDVGAKTMLDVLVPVHQALVEAVAAGAEPAAIAARLKAAADAAEAATMPMQATRGRASFLGERSIGHLDPGGESSRLLIHTVCDVLTGEA
ncbi:MAG: dihydroxyacetone kinase subunit DhaL [Alphaproteobacteria bacterium]